MTARTWGNVVLDPDQGQPGPGFGFAGGQEIRVQVAGQGLRPGADQVLQAFYGLLKKGVGLWRP